MLKNQITTPFRRVMLIVSILYFIFGIGIGGLYCYSSPKKFHEWHYSPITLVFQNEAETFCQARNSTDFRIGFSECVKRYPDSESKPSSVFINRSIKFVESDIKSYEIALGKRDLEREIYRKWNLDSCESSHKGNRLDYLECMERVEKFENELATERRINGPKIERIRRMTKKEAEASLNSLENEKKWLCEMLAFSTTWAEAQKFWKDFLVYLSAYFCVFALLISFAYGIGQRFLGFCFSTFKKLWSWIKTGK